MFLPLFGYRIKEKLTNYLDKKKKSLKFENNSLSDTYSGSRSIILSVLEQNSVLNIIIWNLKFEIKSK